MYRISAAGKAWRIALLLGVLFWSGFPIFLVVLSSFKSGHEIFEVPPSIFFSPTIENYVNLWKTWPQFFDNIVNSLIITAGATVLTVFVSSLAGYAYSRARSRLIQA